MELLVYSVPALSIALLTGGIYQLTQSRGDAAVQSIRERLQSAENSPSKAFPLTDEKLPDDRDAEESILKKKPAAKSWRAKLEDKLERANLLIRVTEYFLFTGLCMVGLGLLLAFGFGWHPALAALSALAGAFIPTLFLNVRIWWRLKVAERQFPEVLDMMVSCFKTGYGFNRAVQQVAESFRDPWGTEFGKMALETSLGSTMEESLHNLSNRLPSPDVSLFVTCILIQKDTGGNMTEMLANLSHTCRERFKLNRKVAAISAQGKLTAVIVCLVPLVIMGFMYLFMSEAVSEFLTNIIGQIVIGLAMFWMLLGAIVLWKMVQIEV